MATPSCLFKLESRPGQLLIDHLQNTAQLCSEIRNKRINFKDADIDVLGDVAWLIGFTHDLGKATIFFQEYLKEKDEDKKRSLRNKKKTHHGLLSSLFTYCIVKDFIHSKNLSAHQIYGYLPIISYLIVKRHHGNPLNLKYEIINIAPENNPEALHVIKEQLESIDADEFNRILKKCPNTALSLKEFKSHVDILITDNICKAEKKQWRKYCKNSSLDIYFLFQFLYSALLAADKNDAAGLNIPNTHISLSSDMVDRYIEKKFANKENDNLINPIRKEIYETICNSVSSINYKDRILSINVPTGTGKTTTGFSFALKLRERILSEKKFAPKIIYCLPFLSIIEQNFDVFENIFIVNGKKPDNRTMLKHHHLAEISYRLHGNEEEFPTNISRLLIETWESEIVVTTFMQLFHTLISNKNRMLKKFNAITNAIVILDEIQTIPYKYWHLIRKLFTGFAEIFNTRFIFMTATQPVIFGNSEIRELVPREKKKEYLSFFDRIKFHNRSDEELDVPAFIQIVKKDIEKYPEDDFLIVLNTINSSIEVFNALKKFMEQKENKGVKLYYLSTNIIPKHRLDRIEGKEGIKQKKCRKIIVSTQLVEAGVDIDVDRVYRDFAPFDSLNQVAGRCNRNFSKQHKKGDVTVFSLTNRKKYYQYVYGGNDLSIIKTKEILKDVADMTEKQFLELGNDYFKRLADDMANDISINLVKQLEKLNFANLDEFKLIETDYPACDLFIEIDVEASAIWQRYISIFNEADLLKRKDLMDSIKADLYKYIISVPATSSYCGGAGKKSEIVYINKDQVKSVYDKDTGFIRKDPTQYVF
jgi:CRISPR-associated endonuclease/helicase Cas3